MKTKILFGVLTVSLLLACGEFNTTSPILYKERKISTPTCERSAGSLPIASLAKGEANPKIPIDHILVIMQENHSFDSYLGSLAFNSKNVDGINPQFFNLDENQNPVFVYHEKNLCVDDVDHTWNGMHESWNQGRNDQFVKLNDSRTMGYYTAAEIPYYYQLAEQFSISDSYFASAMTQTNPNRYYLMTGTSFGQIANVDPTNDEEYAQKTIFDVLNEFHISWRYYTDGPGYLQYFRPLVRRNPDKIKKIADYQFDLAHGNLPQVAFIDAVWDTEDEHPRANIQVGQLWVAKRVSELMSSKYWKSSALFLTYDESGAYYDHVAPPKACKPDEIPPMLKASDIPGDFDQYGFRVPFFAISPFAKKNFVSHLVYDHTSILKFIETKFNLPALTRRDANANDLTDLFNFSQSPREKIQLIVPKIDLKSGCN